MSAVPPSSTRSQVGKPDKNGDPTFLWNLTDHQYVSPVQLRLKLDVLPVIFVPGIMGSNLRSKGGGQPVWRLDATVGEAVGLLWKLKGADAGERQRLLHPDRTEVDPWGNVPEHLPTIGTNHDIRGRGWGQVGETSYSSFLQWLEKTLNPDQHNPALWLDYYQDQATISAMPKPGDVPKLFPGIRMGLKGQPSAAAEKAFQPIFTDDLLKRSKFWMPVHAVGYNWLASNQEAAKTTLKPAIERIISQHNQGVFSCQQVVLITHSMGGLVARACAQLPGMEDKIAGIVHGVMPATGAAVAYRRCKVGMWEENKLASMVIGVTGRDTTAVFAQAAGALQLLPSKEYRHGWLRVTQSAGGPAKTASGAQAWPTSNPYEEIYRVRDRWWGLIKEEWLSPKNGQPISWGDFSKNVSLAESFHDQLSGKYHKNTYAFYGADAAKASFEHVSWQMTPGEKPDAKAPPSFSNVLQMSSQEVRMDGENPEYVGGRYVQGNTMTFDGTPINTGDYESSYWELRCAKQDGAGDGTVPESSGRSPMDKGGAAVKQQFRLMGVEHEPAFKNNVARQATLYAIDKIAGTAKVST